MKHLQLVRLRFTVEEPEAQRGCDMSIDLVRRRIWAQEGWLWIASPIVQNDKCKCFRTKLLAPGPLLFLDNEAWLRALSKSMY